MFKELVRYFLYFNDVVTFSCKQFMLLPLKGGGDLQTFKQYEITRRQSPGKDVLIYMCRTDGGCTHVCL